MAAVVFHRLASRELSAATAWYSERSVDTQVRFRRSILHAVDRIASDPLAHPNIASGPYRYVRVRQFPYVLIYRMRTDGVAFVVAVAHTSRRPEYWRRRK